MSNRLQKRDDKLILNLFMDNLSEKQVLNYIDNMPLAQQKHFLSLSDEQQSKLIKPLMSASFMCNQHNGRVLKRRRERIISNFNLLH